MEPIFMVTESQLKAWQNGKNITDAQMNELKRQDQMIDNENYVILPLIGNISAEDKARISVIKNPKKSGYILEFTPNGYPTLETAIGVKIPPSSGLMSVEPDKE